MTSSKLILVAPLLLLGSLAACDAGSQGLVGSKGADSQATAPFTTSVSHQTFPGESFHQVWGTDDDLWILGTPDAPPSSGEPMPTNLNCGPDRWASQNVLRRRHLPTGTFDVVDQPSTTFITSLHGSGPTDVWMVGLGGAAFQFDGTRWRSHDIRQAEGLAFSDVPCAELSLQSVYARSPSDVWVVGYIYASPSGPGLILHYDGTSWKRHVVDATDGFFDVWAGSATDAWVVGASGLLYHYDGATWTRANAATDMYLYSVLGTGADDVWAVGNISVTTHFDGTGWKLADPGQDYSTRWALAGNHADGVWALSTTGDAGGPGPWRQSLTTWDGQRWSAVSSTTDGQQGLRDLHMTPGGQLWGVGRSVIRFR